MASHNSEQTSNEYPGVIDTIGNAFALLNRRPYLIWMPVALDVLLWSGIRFVVVEPANWLRSWLEPVFPGSELERITRSLAEFELLGFVSLLMPTLIDGSAAEYAAPLVGSSVSIQGAGGGALALLAILVAALIGMTYLTMIGRIVNDTPAWGTQFMRDCATTSYRAVGLASLAVALVAFMILPFAVIAAILAALDVDSGLMLALAGLFIGGWLAICFLFGLPALALGSRSASDALRASYQVVQRNGLAVLGLLLIVILIRSGAPYALRIFTESEWSVPFAIVVNAYIVTGLIAAFMLFYKERSEPLTPREVALGAPGS